MYQTTAQKSLTLTSHVIKVFFFFLQFDYKNRDSKNRGLSIPIKACLAFGFMKQV